MRKGKKGCHTRNRLSPETGVLGGPVRCSCVAPFLCCSSFFLVRVRRRRSLSVSAGRIFFRFAFTLRFGDRI